MFDFGARYNLKPIKDPLKLSVIPDVSWYISKRRRRMSVTGIRAAHDHAERSGSLRLP